MTTALHYSSVARPENIREIFGLQVAVTNWLKAWLRYGRQEKFPVLVGDKAAQDEVLSIAQGAGLDPQRLSFLDQRYARPNFAAFDTIFRADPDTHNLLWQRQQLDASRYNVCALAHAISGLETGALLERFCLDPSEATDAIICPSHAVAKAIAAFWDSYSDYLKQRFGTRFRCPVQLPVIPLGIDTARFETITTPDKRAAQRRALGLQDDEFMLLWVGRLSHAIKAHPLPMFQAAERAAEKTGARVHLVMMGYFVPKEAEQQFASLAAHVCAKAKVSFIASDDARFPEGLWAAGDAFLSLIDNAQESFGLTPVEAAAAGLPRVISDWDGYRDAVAAQGEDGFLIPTLQPPAGQGHALSELLLSGREIYGGFLAKTAQCVAVDAESASEAIAALIRDAGKRRDMGVKARQRARAVYDWKHIIPAYEKLWDDLAERRRAAGNATPAAWPSALPQAPDPFRIYASYPTAALQENGHVIVTAPAETIEMLWKHAINTLALDVMILPVDTLHLIRHIADQGQARIGDLFAVLPDADRPALWRTLAWLIKLGILSYRPA